MKEEKREKSSMSSASTKTFRRFVETIGGDGELKEEEEKGGGVEVKELGKDDGEGEENEGGGEGE